MSRRMQVGVALVFVFGLVAGMTIGRGPMEAAQFGQDTPTPNPFFAATQRPTITPIPRSSLSFPSRYTPAQLNTPRPTREPASARLYTPVPTRAPASDALLPSEQDQADQLATGDARIDALETAQALDLESDIYQEGEIEMLATQVTQLQTPTP